MIYKAVSQPPQLVAAVFSEDNLPHLEHYKETAIGRAEDFGCFQCGNSTTSGKASGRVKDAGG